MQKLNLVRLRGHHIPRFMDYIFYKEVKAKYDPFATERSEGYGEAFIKNKEQLFERLYETNSMKIIIVDSIDDLCVACNEKAKIPSCFKAANHDRLVAKNYGFKVRKIYISKDFINLLIKKQKLR